MVVTDPNICAQCLKTRKAVSIIQSKSYRVIMDTVMIKDIQRGGRG